MNEIITTNSLTIAEKVDFKDKRLSKATSEILKIYRDAMTYADAKNRQVASILARVKQEKSYLVDGFVSVADYATKTFGIKKQNAYSLATAGEVYNDPNASEKLKAFTPSKLAEVATVKREQLEADVESGKITATTTQKDLREYTKSQSEEKSEDEVIDLYTARPVDWTMNLPEEMRGIFFYKENDKELPTPRYMNDWDSMILDYINNNGRHPAEVIKIPKAPALIQGKLTNKKVIDRRLYITHDFSLAVEFTVYKPNMQLEKQKELREMTREELLAKLAELEAKEASKASEEEGNE